MSQALSRPRLALSTLLCQLVVGCGGGEGSNGLDLTGGPRPTPSISWSGSVNDTTVKDASNDAVAFESGSGIMLAGGSRYPGVVVQGSRLMWNGNNVGSVVLNDAQGGGKLATLACTDGRALDLVFTNDSVSYNCVGTTPSGSNGPSYVSWNGNFLETMIKDGANSYFAVLSASRRLAFLGSSSEGPVLYNTPIELNGSEVDASARVLMDGQVIGAVVSGRNGNGDTIMVLSCSNGASMTIAVTRSSNTWTTDCAGTGTGTDTGTGGGTPPVMITWNGSFNGSIVKDANNEDFAFTATDRCLYSYARQEITSNFCLFPNSADGRFATLDVRVIRARSTDKQSCIAVLSDSSGRQVDIATENGRQVARLLETRWDTDGCS